MINEKFSAGYGLIPISIVGSLFNVIVGLISVIYVAEKNTKAIASTSIVSAVINIIVHLVLISFIGLYAAVISTFVAFFVMSIYRLMDASKRYFKIKIDMKFIIQSLIALIFVFVSYYINNIYLNVFVVLFAVLFAVYINKDSFDIIFKLFTKKLKRS